jgi:hypothetical protein
MLVSTTQKITIIKRSKNVTTVAITVNVFLLDLESLNQQEAVQNDPIENNDGANVQ